MCESARMTVGFCARALSSPSSKVRAPTYVNSVPRKVMSATCCIVALSSTHKTILLTRDPPQEVWDCSPPRPTCRASCSFVGSTALAEGSIQLPRIRGPFGEQRRSVLTCPAHGHASYASAPRRGRGGRLARGYRGHRPQGRGTAAPGARRPRGRLLRDRQGA